MIRSKFFRAVLVLAVLGLSVACASSMGGLQRGSARAITPTPLPENVVITDVRRSATSVRWVATAPDGSVYDCSADDMVRNPICVKRQ